MSDVNIIKVGRRLIQKTKIKLLILDLGGVLTDGTLYFSPTGETLKVFNSLDGHGVKMLRATCIVMAIITGRIIEPLGHWIGNACSLEKSTPISAPMLALAMVQS